MIRESKYLIRRILVGVGICLVLGFINSCDVKAVDYGVYLGRNGFSNNYQDFYYNTDELKVVQHNFRNSTDYVYDWDMSVNYKYVVYNTYTSSSGQEHFYNLTFSDSPLYLRNGSNNQILQCSSLPCHMIRFDLNINPNQASTSTYTYTSNSTSMLTIANKGGTSNIVVHTNYDLYQGNNLYQSKNLDLIIQDPISTINSLGVVKNKDESENVIVSYTFNPIFNNFDTSRFNYQYKIGDNNWLNITTNSSSFNVNQNTTVYFRVVKKSDNSVVDSQSFTISNILKYNESVNENYKYTSENRNVNDDESLPNKLVDNVSVTFEYFPKQSNLKYQYQYVEENNSLGTWVDMPSQDYERTYSVTVNGTMYNRILDSNNNVLYTSTFRVNSIGTAMINSNLNWYNKLFGKVNYGKGISSIFFLPVRLLEVYKTGLESGFCNEYSFGELWGHELIIPCINVRGLVGNNIYNFIDIIGVGCISLAIINFIVNIYNGIVFMNLQDRINEDKESRLL